MKRLILTLLTIVWAASHTSSVHAYLAGGTIRLIIDVVQDPRSAGYSSLCTLEMSFDQSNRQAARVAKISPNAEGSQSTASPGLTCKPGGDDRLDEGSLRSEATERAAALLRLSAFVTNRMEDERTVRLELSVEPDGSAAPADGSEASPDPGFSRELTFSDDAVTYIPLWRDDSSERESVGGDAFVRIESKLEITRRLAKFGSIQIDSQKSAEVYLDGGSIGALRADDSLLIEHVSPGLRKVTLESEQGRSVAKFVAVEPDRTSIVGFNAANHPEGPQQFRLEATGENEQGYQEFFRVRDGATMIEIPAGEFLMGNKRTERTPFEHMVYLSTFLIDKTAVTWRQFKEYLADTGLPLPPHRPYWGIHDDHPAVYVTWAEARSYCQWAGGRLPTEAEREKAARGTDQRLYPWGEEAPSPDIAIFRRSWGGPATEAVGMKPLGASPYGALDMGGNVWEWCLDWYSDQYLESSPYENPAGPESGTLHVLRGGSWDSRPDVLSASCRNFGHPGYREGDFGFRCATSAPPD